MHESDSVKVVPNNLHDLDDLPHNFLGINDYAVAPTHAEVIQHGKQRSLTPHTSPRSASSTIASASVVEALQSSPHANNTLIILWSDHGFHLGEKQHWAKRTLWEESTRVPFLIAGPGIEPGHTCQESVSLLDIYPTLVDLCELPANPHLEGIR